MILQSQRTKNYKNKIDMENIDALKPMDKVTVTILGPENNRLYENTTTGFHSLESAVSSAVSNANLNVSPEDCVFEITNQDKGVTHRYRLNAHGHLKLII